MRLLTYSVDKGGSYVQSTVPRRADKAWIMFEVLFKEYFLEKSPESIQITSVYNKGENKFVDKYLESLPLGSSKTKTDGDHKYEVTSELFDQCFDSLVRIDEWPGDTFLEIGVNPVQIELLYKFSWSLKKTDEKYTFPDWYKDYESRSTLSIWLGPKTKVSPYFVFPFDACSPEQAKWLPECLRTLPLKISAKNFRIYEKAKTTDSYRSLKPTTDDMLFIKECINS